MIERNRLIATALACGLVAASLSGCGGAPQEAQETAVPAIAVHTAAPQRQHIEQTAAFTGRITPDDSVAVIPKMGGTVLRTYFEVGDTVQAGDLLMEFDPVDVQSAYDAAQLSYESTLLSIASAESGAVKSQTELQYETALKTAEAQYRSVRDLLDAATDGNDFKMSEFRTYRRQMIEAEERYRKDPSEDNWKEYTAFTKRYEDYLDDYLDYANTHSLVTQFENAYTSYEQALKNYEIYKQSVLVENETTYEINRQQAKLALENAERTLSYTKVYAPIDGVIESKNVTENNMASGSAACYVVSNKALLNVEFAVSATIAKAMSIGDEVTVENAQEQYRAQITEIGVAANQSGLFTVKARLLEGDGELPTGITVKLTAITAKSENAMLVPMSAIYYENGVPYLYVASAESLAVKTYVTLGLTNNEYAEVLAGLDSSAQVIISWNPNLIDGALVQVSQEG